MSNEDIAALIADMQEFIETSASLYNIDDTKENELKERLAEIIIEVFNNVV